MTAPPQLLPPELQSFISPSRSVTSEFSARSKQESLASLISKSAIVRTVPCPEPCLNAVPTLVKVTWSIVKLPTLALLEGEAPWRLPAAIAASLVLAKSTYDISWRSSVPVLHAPVKASPFHSAPCIPSKRIWSVELPTAENSLQEPSKDRPLPLAT